MTNEIKFADTVILVDVAYVDRVAGDLSKHFGDVVGRKLPKADLPVLLECLSLDSGIPLGENAVQVLFIYDEESKKMDAFQPSDLGVSQGKRPGIRRSLSESDAPNS